MKETQEENLKTRNEAWSSMCYIVLCETIGNHFRRRASFYVSKVLTTEVLN